MIKNTSDEIRSLMQDAKHFLDEIENTLSKLLEAKKDEDDNNGGDDGSINEEEAIEIQLILQFRLGCEEVIAILLRLDENLLFALGIQAHQPYKINKDRLAYAVGHEDLKQIFKVLAQLTAYIAKMVARDKSNHASFASKEKRKEEYSPILQELPTLLKKQEQSLGVMEKIETKVHELTKFQTEMHLTEERLLVDNCEAIRSGILYSYQVLCNILENSKRLYSKLNHKLQLEHQLNILLHQTKEILPQLPSTFNPSPHFAIKHFDHALTPEQLEKRAAIKRLTPF